MAAKPIDPQKVEDILGEWRLGEKSQRDLADQFDVSTGFIAKITKGIERDCSSIVSAGVEYRQQLLTKDERMVSKITKAVDKKVAKLEYLSDAALRNVRQAMAQRCIDQQDFRHRANTIKHAVEVIDPQTKPGVAVQINNSQTQGEQVDLSQLNDQELQTFIELREKLVST